jgi:hypothetical protein
MLASGLEFKRGEVSYGRIRSLPLLLDARPAKASEDPLPSGPRENDRTAGLETYGRCVLEDEEPQVGDFAT